MGSEPQPSGPARQPATGLSGIDRRTLQTLMGLEPYRGLAAVVEHLRLRVPAAQRQAWLEAELRSWDPWLRQQRGYLGREVLWDQAHEEGVLLIHWASRDDWKAIPAAAVAAVQAHFEATARQLLALPATDANPFPLLLATEEQLP